MSFFRQFLVLLVIAALGAGGYYAWQRYGHSAGDRHRPGGAGGPGGGAAPVRVVTVATTTLADDIEAVGTTRARQSVEIVPLASGTLVALDFEPGVLVTGDAVLARLDDDIERADLKEAEAKAAEAAKALERSRAPAPTTPSPTPLLGDQLVAAAAVAEAELDRTRRRLADRAVLAPSTAPSA
ncbi:MAG: hypothetical protein R3D02_00435 [Hyphomicrobiales bacterium]